MDVQVCRLDIWYADLQVLQTPQCAFLLYLHLQLEKQQLKTCGTQQNSFDLSIFLGIGIHACAAICPLHWTHPTSILEVLFLDQTSALFLVRLMKLP